MRLEQLLGPLDPTAFTGDVTVEVTAVTEDSRRVAPGTLYCCVTGATADGHDFAARAVAAGAVALLCERFLPLEVTQVRVPSVRPVMARAAAELFGRPSERLTVLGVTGTNGKTTVTHMLASILRQAGTPTAVIGTLGGARTTPAAPDLQELLARELAAGHEAVAMEVSSHALVQDRVEAVRFSAGVFTNLSHDHLDYHGTMEAYFQAKARLFDPRSTALAVVNLDDGWGRRLFQLLEIPGHGYSMEQAEDLRLEASGSTFTWRGQSVRLDLPGDFNVSNALAAATTAAALGVPEATVAQGLSHLEVVRGRMQRVEAGQPFTVLVDFAHTPDGLERVLSTLRPVLEPSGRLAVVFGCGGERDRAKRPLMGELAVRLADLAVLTSDNPRSEDPAAIIAEVAAGAAGATNLVIEADRRAALAAALGWARPGDTVVVAGKGHETGQEVAGVVYPFDDTVVSAEVLAELGYAS